MNRSICQVILNEDIYVNINNLNFLSNNKQSKSISLKYETVTIDEKIAQGGYGTVYKAHSFNKQYALKKLCVNNEDKLLCCIQEIFILKNVHNDYILHFIDSIIYQIDSDIYEVFILTDFYAGDLMTEIKAKHSNDRVFDECDILLIMTNIAEAVACLHHFLSSPIIHRDLKVENILIGYPMRYVLCDFGSATLKEVRPCEVNRQDLQEEISQFTTLAYRSPEMADLYYDKGEHVIGRKSDIWAMGVMMYNICFFSLPFGDSVLSILSGQFTIPDHHSYSDNLLKTINYCLTIHPDYRPDIYQLSSILFQLASRSNPVHNYEKCEEPNLETLTLPMTECEAKSVNINRQQKNVNKSLANQPVATSIIPRNRPKPGGKPIQITTIQRDIIESRNNNNSPVIDLLGFHSSMEKGIPENNHIDKVECPMRNSINNLDMNKIDISPPVDLMDFKAPINHKIKHLANNAKSQSLGTSFGNLGSGQRFNIYEMISHSYNNVSYSQHVPCYGPQIGNMALPMNMQCNNPFIFNNRQPIPGNYTQNYAHASQIGHRRMVSDPSSWNQNTLNSVQSNNSSVATILLPRKMPLRENVTNVLDEFDPLTN